MSADNGVYILETPTATGGLEYRVAHLQNIEKLDYARCPIHGSDFRRTCVDCHCEMTRFSTDPANQIQNAREMWQDSPVFADQHEAFAAALLIVANLTYCEHGINLIEIPCNFATNQIQPKSEAMRFVVYRPLSGPWAQVLILQPHEEMPETIGEGILWSMLSVHPFNSRHAEFIAEGICAALSMNDTNKRGGRASEWHWSHQ